MENKHANRYSEVYGELNKLTKRINMSRLIYIASPYSHNDPAVVIKNFELVSQLAANLCSEGHVAFSPITYGHTLLAYKDMPSDWAFWKNFCLSFLQHCDELLVYQIPGWDMSRGVTEEINFAKENNITIKYITI